MAWWYWLRRCVLSKMILSSAKTWSSSSSALLTEVNAGLPPYEKLQMIVVAKEPWTIENGCLTPTMKIKRSRIETNVTPKVETWYAAKGKILWA